MIKLESFHPVIREWFFSRFSKPTLPQERAWPVIEEKRNLLLLAPTGSGKTLAAFLKAVDWLFREDRLKKGVQILYISPLKALNNDIHYNLQKPLRELKEKAEAMKLTIPPIRAEVRTGDTPSSKRQQIQRNPPPILITTPESLFLMLSSKARSIFSSLQYVIVDEIHTLFPEKRGAHLALSLERLAYMGDFVRIGLSATMEPLQEVAAFLGGYERKEGEWKKRDVVIVDAGYPKQYNVNLELPYDSQAPSHWPGIYARCLYHVRENKTTLIFVNNRRLAERLTAKVNELAGEVLLRTHHGSIAKEMRLEAEHLLREGGIRGIVATSSLELGIDVGHIEFVIQIESPKEVARAIQRVGRAGHVVGLPSKGCIIPKTGLDLLESTVLLHLMKQKVIEAKRAPINCLDVLAQHLVSMTSEKNWQVEELFLLLLGCYTYHTLAKEDFFDTLGMLAGSFETREFLELRPRLHWDRKKEEISKDPYGVRLSIARAGTIPNRGYYKVCLPDGTLLGELDEEFVYERRLGDRFVLGNAVWKVAELRLDRVIVTQAKGQESQIPFWKGENLGRSYATSKALGEFLSVAEPYVVFGLRAFREHFQLEEEVAKRLHALLHRQKEALGRLPSASCVLLEEFPDELGQSYVFVHSLFGLRMNNLLSLLLRNQVEEEQGVKVDAVFFDNGILFHALAKETPFQLDLQGLYSEDVFFRLAGLLAKTTLFGITFRHIAERSLVLSQKSFGRTPLWLSRLKSKDLLDVVGNLPDFPLVKECYREILSDYYSLEDFKGLLLALSNQDITLHSVRHSSPSPFALSYVGGFMENFLYDNDTPKEPKDALFGMRKESLKRITGDNLKPVWKEEVCLEVVKRIGGEGYLLSPTKERVLFFFELRGDVTEDELASFSLEAQAYVEELRKEEKLLDLALGENSLIIAAIHEDAYRGLPEQKAQESILLRFIHTRGPFCALDLEKRYGLSLDCIKSYLDGFLQEELLVEGSFTKEGVSYPLCSTRIFAMIHKKSLKQAREEREPLSLQEYTSFLLAWQTTKKKGVEGLRDILHQLQGLALPFDHWERDILPLRVPDYTPALLDQVLASGLYTFWVQLRKQVLWVCFLPLMQEEKKGPSWLTVDPIPEDAPPVPSLFAKRIVACLEQKGALTLLALRKELDCTLTELWNGLMELMGIGEVTNDTFGPLRVPKVRPQDLPKVITQPAVISEMGRFSLFRETPPSFYAKVYELLYRYGYVSREVAKKEDLPWKSTYKILDYLEAIGEARRGYFVEGLSGIQFAHPSVFQKREPVASYYVLGAEDPANPFRFLALVTADFFVFYQGRLLLTIQSQKLKSHTELGEKDLRPALFHLLLHLFSVHKDKQIVFTHWNQEPLGESYVTETLTHLGFEKHQGQYILWPSRKMLHL